MKNIFRNYGNNIDSPTPRLVDDIPTRRVWESATPRLTDAGIFLFKILYPTLRLAESFFDYEYLRE